MRPLHSYSSPFSLICLLWLLPVAASAQDEFWKKITIRKAFETKTADDNKPAAFSFSAPKESDASWLLNGGVGFNAFTWPRTGITTQAHYLDAFGVYNYNTLVDKEQHNFKVGASLTNQFGRFTSTEIVTVTGSNSLQYMYNYTDTAHSAILTSYWNPLVKTASGVFLGGYGRTDSRFNYFLTPQVGLEYQQTIVDKVTASMGKDARVYFSVGGNILLKKKRTYTTEEVKAHVIDSLSLDLSWAGRTLREVNDHVNALVPDGTERAAPKTRWNKLLELSMNYTGRASLWRHQSTFESYTPLFTAGIHCYPFNTENFSIGLSYNSGANPIDGTLNQTFWLFAIALKK